ncbi:MAG: DUF692 domain-containing protein [Bacteriovoracaceae bacterium]
MIGVGLRHKHFPYLMEKPQTRINWFEGITENFLDTKGRPLEVLKEIRKDYPVGLHGVSLSIASHEELDFEYLKKVKTLYQMIDPIVISDHLCWTGSKNVNLHNLLPISYTEEMLQFLVPKISQVQDFFQRPLALENLSAYFSMKNSTMSEWDFLKVLAERSGCKLLLDLNNVYVNSQNQHFDPFLYVDSIPIKHVSEIHLAGFTDMGDYLFDTHSKPVFSEVWKLFTHKIKENSKVPVLIEWDDDIPDFSVLELEAVKALDIIESIES